MFIQLHEDGTFWRQIKPGRNFEFSDTCFQPPETLSEDEAALYRVFPLTRTARPVFDPLLFTVEEATPVLSPYMVDVEVPQEQLFDEEGEPIPVTPIFETVEAWGWEQRWVAVPLDPEVSQEKAKRFDDARIAALWKAAHEYEFNQISGSAIGLLAMGVMMGKPKCVAVQDWIKSIWTLYYTRKSTGDSSTDFTSCGTCPHSVPELMEELGV